MRGALCPVSRWTRDRAFRAPSRASPRRRATSALDVSLARAPTRGPFRRKTRARELKRRPLRRTPSLLRPRGFFAATPRLRSRTTGKFLLERDSLSLSQEEEEEDRRVSLSRRSALGGSCRHLRTRREEESSPVPWGNVVVRSVRSVTHMSFTSFSQIEPPNFKEESQAVFERAFGASQRRPSSECLKVKKTK